MVNNIPVNGWPQLKDLEAVQPILNRLDKIEAWKRTVKEETFTGDDITIENALALPARSLITEINALQDLHGLPFPYVGGAYKNKLPIRSASTVTLYGVTFTFNDDGTVKANGTATNDIKINIINGSDSLGKMTLAPNTYTYSIANSLQGVAIGFMNTDKSAFILDGQTGISKTYTVSETVETIPVLAVSNGVTLNNVMLYPMLEIGSSKTDFAPYSNICPISGRDSVVVDDVGKNVATTVIYKQDYVIASDGSENSASGYCITDRIDVSANQVYVFSFTRWQAGITDPIRVGTYKADGTFISRISIINNGDTLTVPANCAYVRLSYCNTPNQSTYLYDVQMELGSTTTPYEPYAHSSATIQLGTTVYGADINWDTGVATVTHANIASYDGETIGEPWISSMDEYTQGGTPTTGAQVVYTVATPTTIQLTPEQLEMFKGYNHITLSDGYGTIELKALTGANWS